MFQSTSCIDKDLNKYLSLRGFPFQGIVDSNLIPVQLYH